MTSEQIFDARDEGEQVLWTPAQINAILRSHGINGRERVEFVQGVKPLKEGGRANEAVYDAAAVLEWLGY